MGLSPSGDSRPLAVRSRWRLPFVSKMEVWICHDVSVSRAEELCLYIYIPPLLLNPIFPRPAVNTQQSFLFSSELAY